MGMAGKNFTIAEKKAKEEGSLNCPLLQELTHKNRNNKILNLRKSKIIKVKI
jgi:hypothetical protein